MIDATLSVDVGTTGCKVTAFDRDGNCLASRYGEYPTCFGANGTSELDSSLVWERVSSCIREVAGEDIKIRAVCVSSLGEAAVLIDKNGQILGKSILYNDFRGKDELQEIADEEMCRRIRNVTGQPVSHLHTLWKLIWIRRHKSEIHSQIYKVMFFADFIVYKLSGRFVTDYSLAARSMMFDIHQKKWDEELVALTGLDVSALPETVMSGSVIAAASTEEAGSLGIPKDALVIAGGHDQPVGMLGAGCAKSGKLVNASGTIECVTTSFDDASVSYSLPEIGYSVEPHVVPGLYMAMGISLTGGTLLKWFKKNMLPDDDTFYAPFRNAYAYMDSLIDSSPSSLLVLPYLSGTGTPEYNSVISGMIYGLRPSTTREEIYKACMEGLCYEIQRNLCLMRRQGTETQSACVIGGGSYSGVWLQMKADIWGLPVNSIEQNEAVSVGSAALCAAALGWYGTPVEAADHFVRAKAQYLPDEANNKIHDGKFEKVLKLTDYFKDMEVC